MIRDAIPYAAITGTFCAIFALIVDAVTDGLSMIQIIALAFTSGFCGALLAKLIMRETR